MLTVELLICILLLVFLCERAHLAVQSLSEIAEIASSVSGINRQLIAFIGRRLNV
jgi:hypothetical protein